MAFDSCPKSNQVESFACPVLAFNRLTKQLSCKDALPVCILMDVRMPKMSGLDLHDALQAQGFYPPVIYMTGHGAVSLAVEAMKKGAVTFLEKPFDNAALQCALDTAFSGKYATLEPALELESSVDDTTQLAAFPTTPVATGEDVDSKQLAYQQRYSKLTQREREVLQGIVDGKLNKVIADKLSISIKTVEVHRARVIRKLAAKTLPEMVKMVMTGRVEIVSND